MTHHTDAARAEFEAWARGYGTWEVKRDDDVALGTTGYTDITLTVAWHAVQAARRAPAAHSTWKDHDTAKLVNDLRECAVQYHAAGQLRERIAHLVRPLAARLACAQAAPVPQEPTSKQVVFGAGALLGQPENTADNRHPDWHSAVAKARSVYLAMLAAAPQPPEAKASVSNGTFAAPVQLPEPVAYQWLSTDNFRISGGPVSGAYWNKLYTEQQVRQLLAANGIQERST